ncbi:spo0E like sporulation regulatory protein [Oceanobacillus picturae]|jgi:stage 0 sporulation regulatory protein|uniref:Spo0E like sporulation regulatory protein n=1 Tax=Oceanobacillus picturae TaxID=171693 RepID=A0A0U9HG47_9BACI|nr:aspartyl-phosphate phosphatase Spo0E family protein [Oceanobacillus picturae]RIU96530.1 aspartyl-phosphate phosphatase Spo0E family protein [Oceanobacillus picturae]GAQ18758.1 spo0E like sporulation regulatory protein [Oceanobacillus picturae]
MCALDKLLKRIEFLRKKMTEVALEKGFTNLESVAISQELDRLLNLYDNMKKQNSRKAD